MLRLILILLVLVKPIYSFVAFSPVIKDVSSNVAFSSNTIMYRSKSRLYSGMDLETNNDNDSDQQPLPAPETRNQGGEDLGAFRPSKKLPMKREEVLVGDPQKKILKKEKSVTAILKELAAIQQQGPQKYCILGTRHCSFLHQQIVELLSYALVLSENHVYTSGACGTNAAAIRGALRAERPDLLTVILPQSVGKQPPDSQDLLGGVTDLIAMPQNDEMNLDVASRICNSKLLSETDQLIAFAFHESTTVIEATREAKELNMLVTKLYLD
uniref:SIS domain-containing protein n=1 Tax=Eucampia antarctica TaxID=49252 RepID=A0A7S2RK03_9STRA|mmetsp:Transcript_22800/g.21937  ORF Transcript_22800/g.21937 Transcript_22800/m.21937 type:complete len:270 (+) Transcript_22800:43-852(+)